MYDVCIVGAGPSGLSCAISSRERGMSIALVECGRPYELRNCSVDNGGKCSNCIPCNVIAGFGGCVHYGDSAKLSYYPSGKALYNKLGDDYDRLLNCACEFWHVQKEAFIRNSILSEEKSYDIKSFPVYVLKSTEIKTILEEAWDRISENGIVYYQSEMVDFTEKDESIFVKTKDNFEIECRYLVLAMGRQGIEWLKTNAIKKRLTIETPLSSIGVRFEMPKKYLADLGALHPDFKFRMEYNGYKYKTFCFCAGKHGGRLKFANYGYYTLLDGHVLTEVDKEHNYGNFALMRQLIRNTEDRKKVIEVKDKVLAEYVSNFGGRPIFQTYEDFKFCKLSEDYSSVSVPQVKKGEVFKLFEDGIEDYCFVAEKVFSVIAKYSSCSLNEIIDNTKVIGLEVEGIWDKVKTDKFFKINGKRIFLGGDCGGESQGILQATMSGFRITEGLMKKLVSDSASS